MIEKANRNEMIWWPDLNCWSLQEAYKHRSSFQLVDSAKHFLDQLEEVTNPNHELTNEDILHARAKTVGVFEYTCKSNPVIKLGTHNNPPLLTFTDVGGQVSSLTVFYHRAEPTRFLFAVDV